MIFESATYHWCLFSVAVQMKDLTLEGALEFQIGLSRWKEVLFKEGDTIY